MTKSEMQAAIAQATAAFLANGGEIQEQPATRDGSGSKIRAKVRRGSFNHLSSAQVRKARLKS